MMIKQCNYQKKEEFIDEDENNEVEIKIPFPFSFRVECIREFFLVHLGFFEQRKLIEI